MKAIAMGTSTADAHANLTCSYLKIELFPKLPEILSHDII